MLGRAGTARRVFSHVNSIGRREFSKKHRGKSKFEKPAEEASQSHSQLSNPGSTNNTSHASTQAGGSAPSSTTGGLAAGTEPSVSTSEILFVGTGALICGGLGYYVWRTRDTSQTGVSMQLESLSGESNRKGQTVDLQEKEPQDSGIISTDLQPGVGAAPEGDALVDEVLKHVDQPSLSGKVEDEAEDRQERVSVVAEPETSSSKPSKDEDEGKASKEEGIENENGNRSDDVQEQQVTVDLEPINSLFNDAFGLEAPKASLQETDNEDVNSQVSSSSGTGETSDSKPDSAPELSLQNPPELSADCHALAGALVKSAVEENFGAGENWKDFQAMHKQAESDAKVFMRWKVQEQEKHVADLDVKEMLIAKIRSDLGRVEKSKLEDQVSFKLQVKQLTEQAEKEKKRELQEQENEMRLAASEASNKERVGRIKELDEVRIKLNGLDQALKQRTKQAEVSHSTHKISLGVLALEGCLERGEPCKSELDQLQSSCGDDALVQAALKPLAGFASKGAPTLLQLQDQFKDVRRNALALGMLPKEGGGLLAQAVAKFGAMLKMEELSPTNGSMSDGPVRLDAGLSQVSQSLNDGDTHSAAVLLEKATAGTAAECIASEWITNARNRAIAEQALKVLHARAMCLAISVA